jgi:hypothetical protein
MEPQDYIDAVEQYGSQRAAARELGIPRSTFQENYYKALEWREAQAAEGDEVPAGMKMTHDGRRVPLSEDERKFHADWTMDDCIAHLRSIAEAHPERVITRNFFRVHSDISESTWNRFAGTFEEFKRQAEITLSRHAHRLEKDVAKHASADRYRVLTAEKRGWEGVYRKPSGKRFQTAIICSDVHDKDCDPFWRSCFIDTIARVQPEHVVLGGDIFDLPEFGKYSVDPRSWDVVGRIKWVHAFLRDIRDAAPDAEIIFTEGNHEFRLLRHLAEATPALRAVLSDLHGFTISKLLGLDEYEVRYVARGDLATFTQADIKGEISKNYEVIEGCVLVHHFPEGRNMGLPGVNGHHHKHVVWPFYSPVYGSTQWAQIGCGHRPHASYCAGEQWSMGFMLAHMDTERKQTQFEYVEVKQDFAMIGGKWHERMAA